MSSRKKMHPLDWQGQIKIINVCGQNHLTQNLRDAIKKKTKNGAPEPKFIINEMQNRLRGVCLLDSHLLKCTSEMEQPQLGGSLREVEHLVNAVLQSSGCIKYSRCHVCERLP